MPDIPLYLKLYAVWYGFFLCIFIMNELGVFLCIKIKTPWQSSAKKSASDRYNVFTEKYISLNQRDMKEGCAVDKI
ncbi:hypothetical protein A6J66_014570 [Yersinia enterocolitica]|nr:hypothetical protein A6J66_014570 [Yersinia enterocolitica]